MFIRDIMLELPQPVGKSPVAACVIGFVFGGIGLGIYFKNIIDAVLPIVITLAVAFMYGLDGWLIGALVGALYGYYRVHLANTLANAESTQRC